MEGLNEDYGPTFSAPQGLSYIDITVVGKMGLVLLRDGLYQIMIPCLITE